MNEPVEPDALRRAWKEFIAQNQTEKILISSMAEAVPQHVEGVTYLSRVPGELQLKELENNRDQQRRNNNRFHILGQCPSRRPCRLNSVRWEPQRHRPTPHNNKLPPRRAS